MNAVPHSTIDDEYANAADRDPKILLTTSRNPSAPLTQFVKVGVLCMICIKSIVTCVSYDINEFICFCRN